MTELQINDLLTDLEFTETEATAFMNMITYAKECQEANTIKNLKPYIVNLIDNIEDDENKLHKI